ncbi:integrase, catalytic region, zinc finger, CCHC-type containing protein [Tanacetum coccineum]
MSQDVLLTVMNSMSLLGESMDGKKKESSNLEAELLKSQNAFNDLLKKNDLKAELQDKGHSICKLKDIIKSMREKSKEENVNYDYCEIETKNVELENSVYKVVKALYGLHQAPRTWYDTLAKYLLDNEFHRGKIDQTLFIKKQKGCWEFCVTTASSTLLLIVQD